MFHKFAVKITNATGIPKGIFCSSYHGAFMGNSGIQLLAKRAMIVRELKAKAEKMWESGYHESYNKKV